MTSTSTFPLPLCPLPFDLRFHQTRMPLPKSKRRHDEHREAEDHALLVGRHRERPILGTASAGSRSGLPAARASSPCSGRSRGCPGRPRARFDAKSLSPTTTTRVSASAPGSGASGVGGCRRSAGASAAALTRPRQWRPGPRLVALVDVSLRPARRVQRPSGRSPPSSAGSSRASSARRVRQRRLRPASPTVPAETRVMTRKFSVIGCGTGMATGTDASGADELAEAAGVDDEVVADVGAPLVGERDRARRIGRDALVGRIDQEQQLAAALEERAQRVELRRQKVGLRARRPRPASRRPGPCPPARA